MSETFGKLLLTASAVVMAAAGIAASFLPQEIAPAIGVTTEASLLIQLGGALLLGFAMVNWMARGSLIGGIYNRPLAVGNVAHFTIGGLALVKAATRGGLPPALLVAAAIYILFAAGFGMLMFRSPVAPASSQI